MPKSISSFSEKAKKSTLIKELSPDMFVSKGDIDSYYNHLTVRIGKLAEFVDVIQRLSTIVNKMGEERLVYRGHSIASSEYKLIPSIGRKEHAVEGIENDMIMEMITLRPEEFNGIDSNFDLLSKMQHFGIPTRILDFTYNPFIGLYFACCDKNNYDGRVVCTYDTSSAFTSKTIEMICGMYKYLDYNAITLDDIVGGVHELEKYAHDTIEPLMAKPKYSNPRIRHQAAVFMIFPNVVLDLRSRMVVLGKEHGNEGEYKLFQFNEWDDGRLAYIRKEPDFYNRSFSVDSITLRNMFKHYSQQYPDFRNAQENTIHQSYHHIFKKRFSIWNGIQAIPNEYLENSFVSIIVESKNKKSILKELATFGIDKAYVYPELEYTAEMVRNRLYI